MSKFFPNRITVGTAASVALVAMMAMSVGTVQAVMTQDQQETEEAQQSAEELRLAKKLEYRARAESKLHVAKQALHAARERGAQERLRVVQELRERARSPRVEVRGLRTRWGGSTADRVLAMGEEIELTEQQEAQIRDSRRDQRRAEIERDAQIEVIDLDLDELLENRHTADLGAVEELMQRRASLRVQGQVADMRASQEVWNALTGEQQEKLEAKRHGIYMLRGDRPHSFFFDGEGSDFTFDGGDFEFGEMEFGDFFNELHLGLEGLEGLDGVFELKSDDGEPWVWRFKSKKEDADEEGEEQENGSTEGTAVGISWNGTSIRTMN